MRWIHTCVCAAALSATGCAVTASSDDGVARSRQAILGDEALCGAPVGGEMVDGPTDTLELHFGLESASQWPGTVQATFSLDELTVAGTYATAAGEQGPVWGNIVPSDGTDWSARIRLGDDAEALTIHLSFSVHDLDLVGVTQPRGWVACPVVAVPVDTQEDPSDPDGDDSTPPPWTDEAAPDDGLVAGDPDLDEPIRVPAGS